MAGLSRRDFGMGAGAVALLAGCNTFGAPSGPSPKLFYLGQAKVFAFDPAGSGDPVTLVDDGPKDDSRSQGVNDGIAIHAVTGQIYWTNMGRAPERDG